MTTAKNLYDGQSIILGEVGDCELCRNSSGLSLYYEKDLSKKAVVKLEKLGFEGDKGSSFFEIVG